MVVHREQDGDLRRGRNAHQLGVDRKRGGGGWKGEKGGDLKMDKPGQHVLERSSVQLTREGIEARFTGALASIFRIVNTPYTIPSRNRLVAFF